MSFAEKLAEHLIARQSILERYIDLCPIPCFIISRTGELIFVNEAYQQAFDMRLDQVTEGKWRERVHPDDLPGIDHGLTELMSGKSKILHSDIRYVINGEIVPAHLRITHVPGNGYVGYVLFHCASGDSCKTKYFIDRYLLRPISDKASKAEVTFSA